MATFDTFLEASDTLCSGEAEEIARVKQGVQLVSERSEVLEAWAGVLGLGDSPLRQKSCLLSGCIHCQASTLPD